MIGVLNPVVFWVVRRGGGILFCWRRGGGETGEVAGVYVLGWQVGKRAEEGGSAKF